MIKSESKCECHKLELPRWDIYICDLCGRQLASFPEKQYPSLWATVIKWIKRLVYRILP